MIDTHRLDLVEHYKWDIRCIDTDKNKGYEISGQFGFIFNAGSLREAIDAALSAQAKWSMR